MITTTVLAKIIAEANGSALGNRSLIPAVAAELGIDPAVPSIDPDNEAWHDDDADAIAATILH